MLAVFEDAARKVDGLIIQNSTVRFEATQNSPTLGDALVDLEKQISGLRFISRSADERTGTIRRDRRKNPA